MSDLSDRLSRAKDELGYSTRQISAEADKAGYRVSNATAAVYTNGKHGKPDARTVEALSVVLRVPLAELRELAGLPQQHGKFELAPEADTLTAPQRAAVNEVIRQLAEANAKAGEGHADGSPSMNHAEGNSAAGEVTELFTPPPPIDATAAKRGKNTGRSIRRNQDEDAERPDHDPNED